jgi:EmrB/QacA subfamily drug resistance transporter
VYASRRGRTVLAATITASGIAFLDGTVVNVALPAIGRDLGGGFATLQWVVDAYLLTLGSLVLVGGSLGDLMGRRKVFDLGIGGFAVASALCALAPNAPALVAARAVQGVAAALLVPGSLSLLSSLFAGQDRGRAIGAWSGLSGIFTALGPFVGGWLVAAASWGWRLVFLINLPLAALALVLSRLAVPDLPGMRAGRRLDLLGAGMVTVGLGLTVYPLIEWTRLGAGPSVVLVVVGLAVLAGFVRVEARVEMPMMPPSLFRIRTFSVGNIVTFVIYAALGGAMFLVVVVLQESLGYSALQAGAALLPLTIALLLLSSRVGGLVPVVGPRLLLGLGGLVTGIGLLLLVLVAPERSYVLGVLPGVLVFALGMCLVVAPVTTTVLGDVDQERSGVASGVNNAVARVASLVAVALLPLVSGIATAATDEALLTGFRTAMVISGVMCLLGGLVAWVALPGRARVAA